MGTNIIYSPMSPPSLKIPHTSLWLNVVKICDLNWAHLQNKKNRSLLVYREAFEYVCTFFCHIWWGKTCVECILFSITFSAVQFCHGIEGKWKLALKEPVSYFSRDIWIGQLMRGLSLSFLEGKIPNNVILE